MVAGHVFSDQCWPTSTGSSVRCAARRDTGRTSTLAPCSTPARPANRPADSRPIALPALAADHGWQARTPLSCPPPVGLGSGRAGARSVIEFWESLGPFSLGTVSFREGLPWFSPSIRPSAPRNSFLALPYESPRSRRRNGMICKALPSGRPEVIERFHELPIVQHLRVDGQGDALDGDGARLACAGL